MTNEEIIEFFQAQTLEYYKGNITKEELISTSLDLARADEREKMTEEKVKEYFAGLNGKETALVVLNYLLRGGITDDDLRGLRLQWIKEQPEGVDVWVSRRKHSKYKIIRGRITTGKPDTHQVGGGYDVYYQDLDEIGTIEETLLDKLNISPGQCAKFNIVRCE